ncbi:MAG: hypothetical protein AAFY57_05485 [Cyanobacteria bacterium J06642_2]
MKKLYAAFGLGVLGFIPSAPARAQERWLEGRVMSVIGGDNLLVDINGELVDVDLAGMWPPTQTYNELAAQRLETLLPTGTPISIQPAWESNGQLYAYVFDAQGSSVNAQLIGEGLSLMRRSPVAEPLRSLYQRAHADAQLLETGYYGQTQISTAIEQPASFDFGAIAAAVPPRAAQAGGGVLAAAAVCTTASYAFRRWRRNPERQRRAEVKTLQQQLQDKLAEQKLLERRYGREIQLATDCREQAKVAVRANDDVSARTYLEQEREYLDKARPLETKAEMARHEVAELRSRLEVLGHDPRKLSSN